MTEQRAPASFRPVNAVVGRYLLPHESLVITVRKHPAVLIPALTRVVGGLLAAAVLSASVLHGNGSLVLLVWSFWLVLLVQQLFTGLRWLVDLFAITKERIIFISGLFRQKVVSVQLGKIADVTLERSGSGRIFGYGTLVFELSGQAKMLKVDHVPYPEQLYLELFYMILPAGRDEDSAYGQAQRPFSPGTARDDDDGGPPGEEDDGPDWTSGF
jgi:Bacterial PH domain